MSAQRDKIQITHDISSDDRKTRQNALNYLMTKEKDWFKAKELVKSAGIETRTDGRSFDMIWVDEVADMTGHMFDALKYCYPRPKEIRKKADWKCSALMRHIRKEERHAVKPSKLIKALIEKAAPVYYGEWSGTW